MIIWIQSLAFFSYVTKNGWFWQTLVCFVQKCAESVYFLPQAQKNSARFGGVQTAEKAGWTAHNNNSKNDSLLFQTEKHIVL